MMRKRFKKKVSFILGAIAILRVTSLALTPIAYAELAEKSSDMITKELADTNLEQPLESPKWSPWNWFKKEEESSRDKIPVQRGSGKDVREQFARPLQDFHDEVTRLFDRAFRDIGFPSFRSGRPLSSLDGGLFRPVTDLSASDNEYTITVELPGAAKGDIKVEVENNILTILGEKKQKKDEEKRSYYRQERFYGSFRRVLSLPKDADQESLQATFSQGVLTVTMSRKPQPESNAKEVKIKFD
jgi:HSP20 family protein